MRFFIRVLLGSVLLHLIGISSVRADFDVWPHLNAAGTRILTNGTDDNDPGAGTPPLRVFTYDFDSNPINDPGFNAFDGSFPFPSEISVNILTSLQYWNGVGSAAFGGVPNGESLNLENDATGSNSTVTATSGFQPGFLIGTVDAAGGAHKHLFSTIGGGGETGPAEGIYMVEMRVRLLNAANQSQYTGVADSLPILLLFNNGVDDAKVGDAADWVTTNLVPFGDFDRDHALSAADIPAMLQALANLSSFKSGNSLTDADLIGFADINGDGVVDNADIQAMLDYLIHGGTAGTGALPQSVPEPSTLVLLTAGGSLCIVLQLTRRRAGLI